VLLEYPHQRLVMSDRRYASLLARYSAYRAAHDGRKPVYYDGRQNWTPLPAGF
jgi:hypothetical protein